MIPDIVVLIGQSNMVGQGELPNPQPLSGVGLVHWGGLDPGTENFFGEGLGPGVELVRLLRVEQPANTVFAVCCARDGTDITQWMRGAELYTQSVGLTRWAIGRTGGRVRAVLFWQGEQDTFSLAKANLWEPRFRTFSDGFMADVGSVAPVIFVAIGDSKYEWKYPGWARLRAIQANMPLPPNCGRIHIRSLPMKDDLHYTAEAQRLIGARFYETLRYMEGQ